MFFYASITGEIFHTGRYLAHKQYRGNVLKDDVFKHSRTVLMSKRKPFKQQGLGNKIMQADPFTDEELEILRKKSLLGKDVTCLSIVKLY